ncbi:hypothetical protein VTG60DRAFT_1600 [Thermothelomyces hinnuleus]
MNVALASKHEPDLPVLGPAASQDIRHCAAPQQPHRVPVSARLRADPDPVDGEGQPATRGQHLLEHSDGREDLVLLDEAFPPPDRQQRSPPVFRPPVRLELTHPVCRACNPPMSVMPNPLEIASVYSLLSVCLASDGRASIQPTCPKKGRKARHVLPAQLLPSRSGHEVEPAGHHHLLHNPRAVKVPPRPVNSPVIRPRPLPAPVPPALQGSRPRRARSGDPQSCPPAAASSWPPRRHARSARRRTRPATETRRGATSKKAPSRLFLGPEPAQHPGRARVDLAHEGDLRLLLARAALIDAHGVDPRPRGLLKRERAPAAIAVVVVVATAAGGSAQVPVGDAEQVGAQEVGQVAGPPGGGGGAHRPCRCRAGRPRSGSRSSRRRKV